jgi:hypothetical protein
MKSTEHLPKMRTERIPDFKEVQGTEEEDEGTYTGRHSAFYKAASETLIPI